MFFYTVIILIGGKTDSKISLNVLNSVNDYEYSRKFYLKLFSFFSGVVVYSWYT